MRPLFAARQTGTRLEQRDWEAFVARELGAESVNTFRAVVIDANQSVPMPEDLFGPQLGRVAYRWMTPKGEVDGYRWGAVH